MLNLNKIWKIVSEFLGPLSLVVAISFGVVQCNRANKAENKAQRIESKVEASAQIVDKTLDKDSNEHVKWKPNLISSKTFKESADTSVYQLIDKLTEELKIANNRITEGTVIKSSGSFKTKGVKKDTVIVYKDTTLNWIYNPYNQDLQLGINLRLNSLEYTDGTRILGFNIGTQNLYNDMWWSDKRIKINSIDHIRIVNPIPQNTFALSINSEYRFNDNDLLVGPEAQLNINRWGVNGKYLYNLNTGKKEPSAGVKFHIFK